MALDLLRTELNRARKGRSARLGGDADGDSERVARTHHAIGRLLVTMADLDNKARALVTMARALVTKARALVTAARDRWHATDGACRWLLTVARDRGTFPWHVTVARDRVA